jgi:adenylylsulfate kinase
MEDIPKSLCRRCIEVSQSRFQAWLHDARVRSDQAGRLNAVSSPYKGLKGRLPCFFATSKITYPGLKEGAIRSDEVKSIALWITGLPGSGKSTVSEGIKASHPDFIILRMDELRRIVTPEPSYSESERDIVYRCLVYTAATLVENGHSVVIDATGNMKAWRDMARNLIGRYGEVYLRCTLDVCRVREITRIETHAAPRDIYRKSESGFPVPGVSAPYEEPANPELVVDTDKIPSSEILKEIEKVITKLESR